MLDVVLTIINVILAVVSAFGAWNSIKYFRKSKNLTIFAQTNKALVEVQKMLIKLPEALSASNSSRRGKKGLSLHNTLCDIGKELNANLTEINSNIPTEYSDAIRQLQNKDGFILQAYINSYISGDAVQNNGILLFPFYLLGVPLDSLYIFVLRSLGSGQVVPQQRSSSGRHRKSSSSSHIHPNL